MQSIVGSFVALALMTSPNVKRAACIDAANRYTAAVISIADALRTYEACVAASDRRNACAKEIEALDSAQEDFADAVDDLKRCP